MNSDISKPVTVRMGHPVVQILTSFPIACFICALLTDLSYAQTMNFIWADFSAWLLAAGLADGVVAAIIGSVRWIAGYRIRTRLGTLAVVLGSLLTLALALVNNFVHSRDGWTSVMPDGLALSAVTVVVIVATLWSASRTGNGREIAIPYSGPYSGASK